jgi:Cu+-exporting ATPase
MKSDGGIEEVPLSLLKLGDSVLVRPGDTVPSDGKVVKGRSAIDESMLTGESIPLDKAPGDLVYGGTLNQVGALQVVLTRLGDDTALAKITKAVADAQGSKAPVAELADKISAVFVPIVVGIATLTFAGWLFHDPTAAGLATAIERFVAVLVIASRVRSVLQRLPPSPRGRAEGRNSESSSRAERLFKRRAASILFSSTRREL